MDENKEIYGRSPLLEQELPAAIAFNQAMKAVIMESSSNSQAITTYPGEPLTATEIEQNNQRAFKRAVESIADRHDNIILKAFGVQG